MYQCDEYSPAYFGKGTKLTILDPTITITPPTVQVLSPSRREGAAQQKTLVCVVSRFYPDHVTVHWQINGHNITRPVSTDTSAQRDTSNSLYHITSRLTVSTWEWYDKKNNFTCIVSFFDGNITVYRADWVHGQGGAKGKYLRTSQGAKLCYVLLIFKSCVYGAFVLLLCWSQGNFRKLKD